MSTKDEAAERAILERDPEAVGGPRPAALDLHGDRDHADQRTGQQPARVGPEAAGAQKGLGREDDRGGGGSRRVPGNGELMTADVIEFTGHRPDPPDWASCWTDGCEGVGAYFCGSTGGWYQNRGGLCSTCGAAAEHARAQEAVERLKTSLAAPQRLRNASLTRTVEPDSTERRLFRENRAAAVRSLRARAAETGATAITAASLPVVHALRAWSPPESLLLVGPVASGKTHLVVAAMNDHLERSLRPALFLSESGLFRNARRRAGGREEEDLQQVAESIDVLVLDDLGATDELKGWKRDAIEDIVCCRYNASLPMLITSNLPIADLESAYGKRVTSRLSEMTAGNAFTLSGVDWRG